ncbi:MAG: TraB/GumN family protein [Myxococcota bacterium]|nr:TraB/GumN family protein [Myxococcota bacterium]
MESPNARPRARDRDDVHVEDVDGREFVLIGTAHISRESADAVREVIEQERPDVVCIELDAGRYEALSQKTRFESLDLREILKRRQLATLILNLSLASYQRQLGGQLGVMPGTELLEAARVAEQLDIPVALVDRDVRVTLRRAWRAMSFWQKLLLFSSLLGSLFEKPELTEEDLRELRQQDVVTRLMQELGAAFPSLKTVLIDERDSYLTHKMKQVTGRRVVGVVGAGHVDGMRRSLHANEPVDLEALEHIPPVSKVWKWVGWGIPAVVLGSIAWIGLRQGAEAAGENLLFWVLANGLPSMLGATIALAHPATIAAAFVAAPFTSLTPVIGAGYVTAFVQTYFRPPLVRELQGVMQDMGSARAWWRNRLLRIFLVFLLTTVGSAIGTWVGGAEIVSNLF